MIKLRLVFEKRPPAHYISHLDLMTVFARACARAELALHFSEGFNPHPYLSVACPLPVGVMGEREILDIGLPDGGNPEPEAIVQRLNESLPLGLKMLSAYPSVNKPALIRWASYTMTLHYDDHLSSERFESLKSFFERRPLLMEKKSKGKVKTVDVSELIHRLTWERDGGTVTVSAVLATGERSLNALKLTGLLPDELRPDAVCAVRHTILDERFEAFD